MKAILTFILAFFLSFASAQRTGIVFSSLSETNPVNAGWDGMERCNQNRLVLSTVVKRWGNQSTRFQTRIQDTAICKDLSQLVLNDTNIVNYERWYGFSVYFSTGYTDNYEGYNSFVEFMRTSSDTMPPLVLCFYGKANGMGIWPTGRYLSVIRNRTTPDTPTIFINPLWTVQTNAWNDVVMKIKWANDTTGRIRIWLNGRYVYGYNGRTNYTINAMRIGSNNYSWSKKWKLPTAQTTMEMFVDELRVGSTSSSYLDVFPDNNDPAPAANSANQFYQVVNNRIDGQKISFKVQMDTTYQANWELRNSVTGKRMMSGNFRLTAGYRTYILNLPFNVPVGNYTFLVGTNHFMHIRKLPKS